MASEERASIDSLIEDLGDCGLFQVLMVLLVHGSVISSEWSTTFMAYGNYNPGWTCNDSSVSTDNTSHSLENSNLVTPTPYHDIDVTTKGNYNDSTNGQVSISCSEYQTCEEIVYSQDSSTIVTEWHLDCDRNWIASFMLSVQGGGFILGTLVAGVLNNRIGRNPTHYIAMGLHVIFNMVAAASVHWAMFAVMRFFLGLTSDWIAVTNFVYPMEFVTEKWRAVVSAIPFSATGGALFGLVAMFLRSWRHLHVATAIITAVLFLPVVWIPESIRWLAIEKKTDKAGRVVQKISKLNRRKPCGLEAIHNIANCDDESEKETSKFTILDLYRHGFAIKTSVVTFVYVSVVVCYTIVMFGIKSLSGNFYLNLILFCFIPGVFKLFLPILTNSLGSKFSMLICLGISCACCVILIILDMVSLDSESGLGELVTSLMFMVTIDASWAIIMLFCVELYPTSLRSLVCSYSSCVSKMGGMLAPFLIPHDEDSAFISHLIMGILSITSFMSVFLLPETKGKHLYDTVSQAHS